MIYPTPRAVLLLLAGAPVALLVGLMRPDLWVVAAGWVVFVALLVIGDALASAGAARLALSIDAPARVGVGDGFMAHVRAAGFTPGTVPRRLSFALAVDDRIAPGGRIAGVLEPAGEGHGTDLSLTAVRRGTAAIDRLWVRWTGPLGLMWKQRSVALDHSLLVLPSIRAVRDEGARLFTRDALFGVKTQLHLGEGSEYEALAEYRAGMDRRSIDWKQSARHVKLLAKEYRIERDNRLVLAIDTGRTMCEPVAGVPRVDRAVAAALLLGYVGLKAGDRVSLFGFAARPETMTPVMTQISDFHDLQAAAATLDYRHEESNFTLALARLGSTLKRRSLIVLFTEFTDPTSADLMIRAAGRLAQRHVLLFVVAGDADLDADMRAVPDSVDGVVRATVAAALHRDRRIVIARLQRMGIHVIEAPHDRIGPRLIDAWLAIKRQGAI